MESLLVFIVTVLYVMTMLESLYKSPEAPEQEKACLFCEMYIIGGPRSYISSGPCYSCNNEYCDQAKKEYLEKGK